MTALTKFDRLESGGLWRAAPNDQRREVMVSLGNATLVISDSAGRALTHWSLPAVERMNAGERPALFTPAADGTDTLEISDDLMISAMEKVRKTVNRRRYRPGRLRNLGLLTATAAIVGLAVFWLPDALIREAQSAVPAVKRAEIGATLLGHIQHITGQTCRSQLGTQALETLHARALGPDAGGQVFVVPSGPDTAIYLPGGLIVMNRDLIEDTEDPAAVGGHIIAAAAQLRIQDPLAALLKNSGIGTTFTLLTQGEIAPETLRSYAEELFANPPQRADDAVLLDMFANAQLPSTPYAFAVDVTGETTLSLIEADPMQGLETPEILSDAAWISLQGICT
ncbi:hypothetical protein OAN307_c37010 [Octadecabacter antarcticus 307]|uniref:Peptidase M48 domain-containing protein n=1 Tax=Octadecabacter antarcticus 307 TaxID=391626 RepID=M9RFF3_9RHOB|nr:hypothetical protein [Octadecabacter antarcticus]AGI69161.1 hypothetical protein OAN307_c37010 [Octadecabacter antarcticus 307]